MEELGRCTGFQWDEGNATKNWRRHRVSRNECEQVFFNEPLNIAPNLESSQDELRYYALGQTDAGRRLFLVCTVRGEFIRVISARDMTPRERRQYEYAAAKAFETDSEV